MTKLDTQLIDTILEQEIQWCFDNKATNLTKKFQEGFVAGLEQARTIIKRMTEVEKESKI